MWIQGSLFPEVTARGIIELVDLCHVGVGTRVLFLPLTRAAPQEIPRSFLLRRPQNSEERANCVVSDPADVTDDPSVGTEPTNRRSYSSHSSSSTTTFFLPPTNSAFTYFLDLLLLNRGEFACQLHLLIRPGTSRTFLQQLQSVMRPQSGLQKDVLNLYKRYVSVLFGSASLSRCPISLNPTNSV